MYIGKEFELGIGQIGKQVHLILSEMSDRT